MLSIWIQVSIAFIVGMSLRAMRFVSVLLSGVTSPHIFKMGDGLQVKRIHATANPATVIQLQSAWNWSNLQYVSRYVCRLNISLGRSYLSVAIAFKASNPEPATGIRFRQSHGQKALDRGAWFRSAHVYILPHLRNLVAV